MSEAKDKWYNYFKCDPNFYPHPDSFYNVCLRYVKELEEQNKAMRDFIKYARDESEDGFICDQAKDILKSIEGIDKEAKG